MPVARSNPQRLKYPSVCGCSQVRSSRLRPRLQEVFLSPYPDASYFRVPPPPPKESTIESIRAIKVPSRAITSVRIKSSKTALLLQCPCSNPSTAESL